MAKITFRGEHESKISAKGEITLPKFFLRNIQDINDTVDPANPDALVDKLHFVRSPDSPLLKVLRGHNLAYHCAKHGISADFDSQAMPEPDAKKQIKIPAEYLSHAGLSPKDTAYVLGNGEGFIIVNANTLEEINRQNESDYIELQTKTGFTHPFELLPPK